MKSGIRGRILCVEDNEDECDLIREILNDYDVTCVSTIGAARKMLEEAAFDLPIIDEHLPDGSGMNLCRQLTAEKSKTSCVIVSGDTFITLNEAKEAGAEALLMKSTVSYIEELESSVCRLRRSANA